MRSNIIPRTVYSGITFTTLIIIASAFILFFFVKVRNNESKITERGFRILNQYVTNLNKRFENYESMADNEYDRDSSTYIDLDYLMGYEQGAEKSGSLRFVKKTSKNISRNKSKDKNNSSNSNSFENFSENSEFTNFLIKDKQVKIEYESGFVQPESLKFKVNEDNKKNYSKNDSGSIVYSISYKNLVKDIFGDEVFSDYLLIKDNELIFKTLDLRFEITDLGKFSNKMLIANNNKKTNLFTKKDTSINSGYYFKSGYIADINIAQTQYKLFLYPILPAPKNIEGKWYVGGLIKESEFVKAKRSVPTWITILITLFFIAVLISFPVIKLFVLKSVERIQSRNLYFAGAAFIVGFAILNIFFLNQLTEGYLVNQSEKRIRKLNDTIKTSFEKEIVEAYNTLVGFDKDTSIKDNKYNINLNELLETVNVYDCGDKNKEKSNTLYNFFKAVFWMDNGGQQILQIATWKDTISLSNLSTRDYFKDYSKWMAPGTKPKDSCLFNLQSIYSNTSGEALVALSTMSVKDSIIYDKRVESENTLKKDTANALVVAITSPMYSIIETILPKGIEFRIIDNTGEVWFHNNKNKNLQENLFTESDHNRGLVSQINSRKKGHLKLNLYNRSYRAYVSPIENVGLHLVTLESKKLNIYQNAQISVALLFYLAIFLIISVLIVMFLAITSSRNKLYRNSLIVLNWLLPRPKNSKFYKILTVTNMVQILILFALIFTMRLYFVEHLNNVIVFVISIVVLNILFTYYLLKVKGEKINNPYYKQIFYWLGILLLLIQVLLCIKYQWYWIYAGVILFQVFLVYIVYKNYKKIAKIFKRDYLAVYRYYLLTVLIFISILIPIYVYKTLFIETNLVNLKHQQFYIAKQTEERDLRIDEYFIRRLDQNNVGNLKQLRKEKGNYGFVYSDSLPLIDCKTASVDNIECTKSLVSFYPVLDNMIGEKNEMALNLYNNSASDSLWNWELHNIDSCKLLKDRILKLTYYKKKKFKDKKGNDKTSYEESHIESSFSDKSPLWADNWYLLLYLFVIAITTLLLNYLLGLLLKKIFFNEKGDIVRKYDLKQAIKTIKQINGNSILINVLDYEEIKIELEEKIKNKTSYHELDINTDFNTLSIQKGDIYFCFGLSDNISQLKTEIKRISAFEDKFKVPVIVLSKYTPKQIIKKIENQVNDDNTYENQVFISQLKDLFAKFITLYIKNDITVNSRNEINKELSVSSYLLKLEKILKLNEFKNQESEINSKQIDKIKEFAGNYYQHIWNTCTQEERFILYDLADDSIANIQNRDELITLIGKGLIKKGDGLELMNKSFASFILDQTNKDKLIYMEIQAKRVGGWVKFRVPLLLIGISIAVFIFTTQQDLVAKLYGVLISVGGIISVASRFNVIFNKGGTTNDK